MNRDREDAQLVDISPTYRGGRGRPPQGRTALRAAGAILLASKRFEFLKGGIMRRIVASSVFLAIAADHPAIGGAMFPGIHPASGMMIAK